MKKVKVLIFPSGTEGALEIYEALKYNLHFELYGISGKKNYTDYIYPDGQYKYADKRFYITDPDFRKAISEFIDEMGIDYIIPTFDDVALKLMEIAPYLSSKIVCSPYETALIASDKRKMYQAFEGEDFIPKTFSLEEASTFPLFIKPAVGCGSNGAHAVNNPKELKSAIPDDGNYIISEMLPGNEITVDCFTDKNGRLLFIGPRVRERIWHGITFRGKIIPPDKEIRHIASTLNERLEFRGAWFFQAKYSADNKLKLLEFSARQSTNGLIFDKIGVNLSALSLFDAMGLDVSVNCNEYNLSWERRTVASYHLDINYSTVYIDFDDTITTHNKINSSMIKLIYQFINQKKKLILITRHETDLYADMKAAKISKSLFDEIIWIRDETPKADYINPKSAIFIDNYFKERNEVWQRYKIPVFDVSSAEGLIDSGNF